MTKHQWFELIANGALVGLGAMWFIIFGLILDNGYARLVENNPWILWGEFATAFIMMVLGIERSFDDIKKFWFRRKK